MKKIFFGLFVLMIFVSTFGYDVCKFPYGSQYGEDEYNEIVKLIGKYESDSGKMVYLSERDEELTIFLTSNEGEIFFDGKVFKEYILNKVSESFYYFPFNQSTIRIERKQLGYGESLVLVMDNEKYKRVFYGPEFGETFKIDSLYGEKELKRMASEAQFPFNEDYNFDLVNLAGLDDSIKIDIKYSTSDNFMGIPLYSDNLAYLQNDAASNLLSAVNELKKFGVGIIVYDAYRPWTVTKMFYDATPEIFKRFVANPDYGSKHNRGGAVDLGLYFLKSGEVVDMGSDYDEFSERAYSNYPALSDSSRYYRNLLKNVMEKSEFTQYEYEWWHFDFKDWKNYPVMNVQFEDIE